MQLEFPLLLKEIRYSLGPSLGCGMFSDAQGQTQFGIFTLKVVDAAAVGAAAVVTTLLGFVVEFLKGKAPANRKNKAYDDADRHLSFLEKWVQLSQHATPELSPETRLEISQELQKIRERLAQELEVVHAVTSATGVVTMPLRSPCGGKYFCGTSPSG